MPVLRMQQRLAVFAAPDLELRQGMMLVSFNEQQIAGRNAPDLVFQRRLRLAAELVHDDPAPVGHDHDLAAARLAVAIGILARLIDVEAVMRVLDHRHLQAALDEARNELLDQGGLAAPRPSREAEDLHARHCIRASFPRGYSGRDFTSRSGKTTARRRSCTLRSSSAPRARRPSRRTPGPGPFLRWDAWRDSPASPR